ncbi:MAG: DoxX family protein [Candidatus Marinimicrobia bacterium]|nr:DoxX family protein [Candidatus Neomarinimicrobiota bacterium]
MEFLNRYKSVVHWLPRLSLASIFLYHGFTKFPMASMMADMMGMPVFMVYMLAMMEILIGVFIILGAMGREILTKVAGLLIAVIMLGAILMIHIHNGWNGVLLAEQGVELQLFILTSGLYYLVKGNDVN